MTAPADFNASCPIPIRQYPHILMAHGGGGLLTQQLLDQVFLPAFQNPTLATAHDAALLQINDARLAFTTDSFVVRPLFFPGGDIGRLAICGTVNDLAMSGATPRWLSASFILEEGLPVDTLQRVVHSMQLTAREAGVTIVTGDTKVVDKGKGDSIFINTSGIGTVHPHTTINPAQIQPGDAVLVSGDLGRHGMAIMSVREGLEFESPIQSDCAPLHQPIADLLQHGAQLHCLRDLTRGGLATALNEIAHTARLQIDVTEATIPVSAPVRAACEILGLDPLYVANEGRFVAFVPESQVDLVLSILKQHPVTSNAARVGSVAAGTPGLVTLRNSIGSHRILDRLTGEQLPRIC